MLIVVLERSQFVSLDAFKMYCVMLTRFERAKGVSCGITCLAIWYSAGCAEFATHAVKPYLSTPGQIIVGT